MKTHWTWAACLLGACAMMPMAHAGEPATQPTAMPAPEAVAAADPAPPPHDFPTAPDGFRSGRRFGGRHGRGSFMFRGEWTQVSAFMQEHSPVRLKFINDLPEGPRKNAMQSFAARTFHTYQQALADDPKLAAILVNRVELEDQVFDLAGQVRHADPVGRDALKQDLRQKVSDLVDTNIKERQLRIDRLETTLGSERARLAQDQKQRDKLVDQKFNAVMQEAKKLLPHEEPPAREAAPAPPEGTTTAPR
jgi:hypothetical protein